MGILRGGATYKAILAACGAVAAYFATRPRMWDDDSLSDWAAVSAILTFLVGLAMHAYQQYKRELEDRRREAGRQLTALRDLQEELKDNLSAIVNRGYLKVIEDPESGIVSFTGRYLYHRTMDSITHGGQVSAILSELRRPLNDIYALIEMHNYYLRRLLELGERGESPDVWRATISYYRALERDEKILREEIPLMVQALKDVESRVCRP